MAFEDWISLSYTKNSVVPRASELILIPFPFNDIDVWHGPSSHYTPSNVYSASNTSTSNINQVEHQLRPVIVLGVLHMRQTNSILIGFLPIVSYSSPPKGRTGPWDADRWMSQEATDIQRLYHIPVPATNWVPSYSPSHPSARLSFGSWKNNRASWVAMTRLRHVVSEDQEWLRHPDGPVILNRPTNNLLVYLDNVIPLTLNDYTNSTLSPNTQTDTISHDRPKASGDASSISTESATESGSDDPREQFWIHPGASKAVLEYAQREAQAAVNKKVLQWQNNCVTKGGCEVAVEEDGEAGSEDRLTAILEDVDVQEVLFGEEACGVDTLSNWQRGSGVNRALESMCDGLFASPHSARKHVQVCRYMY